MPEDTPRPGTTASLEARVARLEAQYERIDAKVDDLSAVVSRVELNQKHSDEVNKLRFDGLTTMLDGQGAKLTLFIERIEKMISGELQGPQQRVAEAQLAEWQRWRTTVDQRQSDIATLSIQIRFLGRLAVFLTGGSLVGALLAVYAAFFK